MFFLYILQVVHKRLDKTIAEVLELKKDNERLRHDNAQLTSQVTGYKTDAERVQEYEERNRFLESQLEECHQKIKELTLKVSHLQTELDGAEESRRNSERNSAQDKLRMRISDLTRDLRAKEKEIAEFDDLSRELRAQLQERTEQLEFELVQKDKLIMVIQRLEDELKARDLELQKRRTPVKRDESPSFRDFVHMKREINDLKDENEALKQSNRKPLALPSLKSPSGEGKEGSHQSLSTQSTWSSKWNKR